MPDPETFIRSQLPAYGRLPRLLLRDFDIPDRAVRVFGLLDDYAGQDGKAFPSRRVLAAACSCSKDSIDRAIAALVDGGWLLKEVRRREDGSYSSTLYTLTLGPVDNSAEVAAPVRGGSRTGAATVAAPVRPHEGEPPEGEPVRQTSTPTPSGVRDDDPHWTRFWSLYPRKLSKADARKAWGRALPKVAGDPSVIIRAVERYAGSVHDLKFVPYPATWLNRERWLDATTSDGPARRANPPRGQECPDHVGEWIDNCRVHASERIAAS